MFAEGEPGARVLFHGAYSSRHSTNNVKAQKEECSEEADEYTNLGYVSVSDENVLDLEVSMNYRRIRCVQVVHS